MRRRNQGARFHQEVSAGAGQPELEQRIAIRESLRRGYREMGRLNLALAEEGLVFEQVDEP